jgi:DEAD/DEAH box helicase domain-containing protein
MTVDSLLHALSEDRDYYRCIASIREFPRKQAEYGECPLHPSLAAYLSRKDIRLYNHQADAIRAAVKGENVILTTSTASGKTLAFLLPVFEKLDQDPSATALFIYPTKALANDQLKAVQELEKETGIVVSPAIYDGDTPRDKRPGIRKSSRIILTNPHELHQILPWHHQWSAFFRGLSFIVIDETHRYRGVPGSHMAFLLRRLRRICRHYGSDPGFILSSATLANPGEFALRLCGVPFTLVAGDGAPHGPRQFVLVNPYNEFHGERSLHHEAAGLIGACISHHLQTLAFTGSRKMAELVALWAREGMVHNRRGNPDDICSYRAGYLPEERREIEDRLKSGELRCVVSTNALELGIDIGSLDAVVMAGYPGTMMATWQQAGRAGRNGTASAAFLIAGGNPLDQYFMRHPDLFFGAPHESAIIDLANPYILSGQVLCAAAELPVTGKNIACFGPDAAILIEALIRERLISQTSRGLVYSGSRRPHELVSMGSISRDSFRVISEGRTLETLDRGQAFREAHQGAVLLHQGDQYLVDSMDIEHGIIRVSRTEVDYYTRPLKSVDIQIKRVLETEKLQDTAVSFGEVEVTEQYYAYKIIRKDTLLGVEPLGLPPLRFSTRALWFSPTPGTEDRIRSEGHDFEGGLHGTEHAFIAMMPMYVLCDRWDIGGVSMPVHAESGGPVVFVYDGYEGGIGLSEKAYHLFNEIVRNTLLLVEECPCETGCPSCIFSPKCGNDNQPLDKKATVRVLESLCGPVTHDAKEKDRHNS